MGEIAQRDTREVPQHASVTPNDMLNMAVQQGADLERLEKLMDLQQRWEENEARKAFVAALNAFKASPPELTKNRHVSYTTSKGRTEYDHATLDHVSHVIGSALSRHGISHRWDTQQLDGGLIRVTCILTHDQGHSERTSLQAESDQSGGKNNIQAIGSTVTYLQRYTLLAATGMAVTGQDDDGAGSSPKVSADQVGHIEKLLKECGASRDQFIAWIKRELKASSIEGLNQTGYKAAVETLERKKGAKK